VRAPLHRRSRAARLGGAALAALLLAGALLPLARSQAGAPADDEARARWFAHAPERYRLTTEVDFQGRLSLRGGPAPRCRRTADLLAGQEVRVLQNTCPSGMIASRPDMPTRIFPVHPVYGIIPIGWQPSVAELFALIETHGRTPPADMGPCRLVYLPADAVYDPQFGFPSRVTFTASAHLVWTRAETWVYIWQHRALPECPGPLRTTITATVRPLP
jgi:hypothetical protein